MEPFSILCQSCAARLKVTKATAVGQVLACPKCGTMISVTPPDGWVPPESHHSNSQDSMDDIGASNASAVDLEGDFDDIDHILSVPQTSSNSEKSRRQKQKAGSVTNVPRPQKRRSAKTANRSVPDQSSAGSRQRRPATSGSPNQALAVDRPVLPNEQWTSDETRKRKRIVVLVAGVVAMLVLLGTGGTAIVLNMAKSNPGDNSPSIPDEEDPGPAIEQNDDATLKEENLENPESVPSSNGESETGNGQLTESPNNDESAASDEPTDTDPKEVLNGDTNNPELPANPSPPNETKSPFDGKTTDPNLLSSLEPSSNPADPSDVGMVEAFESDLGNLTALLEASGTSLLDFKDLTASIRTQQNVGIPKYIMSFPEPSRLDIQRQLEMPIGGVKFDSVPLVQVVQHLTSITGVPITVDARSIASAAKPTNPNVSITKSDSNLEGVLTEILAPLGLSHQINSTGLTIGVFPAPTMTEATFDLPKISGDDIDGKKRIVAAIQIFVDPISWARDDDPATINLEGNQIVVRCSPNAQTQIASLLSKLDSSLALKRNPDDANALTDTESRWSSIEPLLAKNPGLSHSVQSEIGSFLSKLHSRTGLSTVVDWQNVVSQGWTPQTIVPGNILEPTVEKAVAELARAMDLTFRAVDKSTLMITTFEQSARIVDLEIYPVGSLVPDRLKANQLARLVSEALGTQLQSERVKFIFEPNCHCLIVSAPQQIQRQVEALVERLQQDLVIQNRESGRTEQALNPLAN